jgi:hypothetical protein
MRPSCLMVHFLLGTQLQRIGVPGWTFWHSLQGLISVSGQESWGGLDDRTSTKLEVCNRRLFGADLWCGVELQLSPACVTADYLHALHDTK